MSSCGRAAGSETPCLEFSQRVHGIDTGSAPGGVIRQNPSRVGTIDIPQPNTRHSAVMILMILRMLSLAAEKKETSVAELEIFSG
jgi:hypothetical protein